MSTIAEFGKRLKNVRLDKRLTQSEVAERAGIHVNYYAQIERGEVNPTYEVIEALVKALNITSDVILPF